MHSGAVRNGCGSCPAARSIRRRPLPPPPPLGGDGVGGKVPIGGGAGAGAGAASPGSIVEGTVLAGGGAGGLSQAGGLGGGRVDGCRSQRLLPASVHPHMPTSNEHVALIGAQLLA